MRERSQGGNCDCEHLSVDILKPLNDAESTLKGEREWMRFYAEGMSPSRCAYPLRLLYFFKRKFSVIQRFLPSIFLGCAESRKAENCSCAKEMGKLTSWHCPSVLPSHEKP